MSDKKVFALSESVGKSFVAWVPIIDKIKLQELVLRGTEPGGIWVESQGLTDALLRALRVTMSQNSPVFFLPFTQITFLMIAEEAPAISRTLLG